MGSGNFGGLRSSPAEKSIVKVPDREPDMTVQQTTSADQVYHRFFKNITINEQDEY